MPIPPRKKGKTHEPATVFDLQGLAVLIARNISEVPKDVRFAALSVLLVEPPSARHIHAARRLSGRPPIFDEHALLLSRKPQNVLLAGILKRNLGAQEIAALDDLERPDAEGPSLFELPGYEEAKVWARRLQSDVARWRGRGLPWKEIGGVR